MAENSKSVLVWVLQHFKIFMHSIIKIIIHVFDFLCYYCPAPQKKVTADNGDSQILSYAKRLHRILECPICLEVVKAPVQECTNGHLTCSACVAMLSIKICSLCQQQFCIANSTFVKTLLDSIPQICRFADQGCKHVCVSGEVHEQYCNFRTVTCRAIDCEQVIRISQLQTHYEDKHPAVFCITKLNCYMHWPSFDPEQKRTAAVPVFVHNQVFFLHLNNDSATHKLKLTLEAFLLKNPEGDLCLTIKFQKGNVSFCKTIKAIVMNEDGDNIASDTPDDDFSMIVSHSFLPKFIDEDKKLQLSYTFLTL